MIRSLAGGLMKELRLIPYTVVAVLGLGVIVAGFVWPGWVQPRATMNALDALASKVSRLEHRVAVEALKNRVTAIDREIFDLQRESDRAARAGIELAGVVQERLHRLGTEKQLAEMELRTLLGARPQAADYP